MDDLESNDLLTPKQYADALRVASKMPKCANCGEDFGNAHFGAKHFCLRGYSPETGGGKGG